MKPDLRNVITVTEAGDWSRPRFIARHRAFSEARAEGESPREAILALKSALSRSSAWAADTWHCTELARAMFDVESILWLLSQGDHAMTSGAERSRLRTHDDRIFYSTADAAGSANRDDRRPGSVETPGDEGRAPTILVYSVGRRCATRRRGRSGEEPGAGRSERSRLDRRTCDRRQISRFALMAAIPPRSDPRGEGTKEADLSTHTVT